MTIAERLRQDAHNVQGALIRLNMRQAADQLEQLEAERDYAKKAVEHLNNLLTIQRRELTEAAEEQCIKQRVIGHGEGQEHTIADVNAGRVDDLIRPRLEQAALAREQP